jgi:TonB-linked SusC/RagA family outer membrane protein
VEGTVTDAESGETIPGVNVALVELNTGSATNPDGEYTIEGVPEGTYTLRATFVGYQTFETEVTVQANQTVTQDIAMQPGTVGLDEVVVTGYGSQQRSEVSGSVSSVTSEDLQDIPAQNPESLLQGRAAGVTVSTTSGNPGSGFEVDIRGEGSINAGGQPLYIVDGVQVSFNQGSNLSDRSPLNAISPNDIESIEVLKDAAAASIYGAQASNGVVLITTKSGRQGDTNVSLRFEGGVRQDRFNWDVLSQQDWIDYQIDALGEANFRNIILPVYGYSPDVNFSELAATDWREFVTRDGAHRSAEFTANGGTENTQFYLSGGWSNTEAGLRSVAYEKYNFRTNLTQQFTDRLSATIKVALSSQDMPSVCQDGFFINCPFSAIQFEPPISFPFLENGDYNPNTAFGQNNNVAVVLNEEERSTNLTQIIGNFQPTFRIAPWLRATGNLGIDFQQRRETDYEPPIADPGDGGSTNKFNNTLTNITANATLNADKTFSDVHDVSGLVGTEYRREFETFNNFGVQGFNNPLLSAPSAGSENSFFSGSNTEFRLFSVFSRASYTYDSRYTVQLTGRVDGTSRFGSDQRFGFFPSGAVSWRIAQEDFFTVDAINELKLRVSYGVTGNSSIGNFASRGLYNVSGSYQGQVGFDPGQIANPQLTWEENQEINIGLDYGLWSNRVTGAIDVYRSTTNELLLGRPLPRSSGFASITENIGAVENQGVELSIETVNILTEDFRWSTRFNVGINQNTVEELTEGAEALNPANSLPIPVGRSLEAWRVPIWAGVNPADGRPMYYDADGNITYQTSEADEQFFDGGEEDAEGGFGTRITYKGLSLDTYFQFSYGSTALPNTERAFLSTHGAFNAGLEILNRRWREPGDVTDVPGAVPFGDRPGTDAFSGVHSYWLYDASYLRLKSMRLSYNLPSNLMETVGMRGARVYVSGFNLVTWTSYIGLDPEVAGAFNTSSYPAERQFNFGIELNL